MPTESAIHENRRFSIHGVNQFMNAERSNHFPNVPAPHKKTFFPQTKLRGGGSMHDKQGENEAAKMAWKLFEQTGSISYYMLYYDLIRR
jgi:hypothetical protein